MAEWKGLVTISPANSGAGDSIRAAFDKVNNNLEYLKDVYIVDAVDERVANVSSTFSGGTITGSVDITDTTVSADPATGALVVAGGVGIDGDINSGGDINVGGSGTFAGDVAVIGDVTADNIIANTSVTADTITATDVTASGAASFGSVQTSTISSSTALITIQNDTIVSGDLTVGQEVGITGNLSVNGGITVSGSINGTMSWFNGNIVMSAGYGINSSARLIGNLVLGGSSESTGVSSGGLRSNGGLGVAGNAYIGKDMNVLGNTFISGSYVPSSSSAAGSAGQMSWDSDYFYVCVATDTWIRFSANVGSW
jgi:cytoskeletal protein CcmA (bactofilin family)